MTPFQRTPLLLEVDARLRDLERRFASGNATDSERERYYQWLARVHGKEHSDRVRYDAELPRNQFFLNDAAKYVESHANAHKVGQEGRRLGREEGDFRAWQATNLANHRANELIHNTAVHMNIPPSRILHEWDRIRGHVARALTRDLFPKGRRGDVLHRGALAQLHEIHRHFHSPGETYRATTDWRHESNRRGSEIADALHAGFADAFRHHGYDRTHRLDRQRTANADGWAQHSVSVRRRRRSS